MSSTPIATELQQLLKDLDQQKEAYEEAFRKVQEYIASQPAVPVEAALSPSSTRHIGLPLQPLEGSRSPPPSYGKSHVRRLTGLSIVESSSGSRLTGDESDDEADQCLYVQDVLPRESYEEDALRTHLRSYPWDQDGRKVIQSYAGRKTSLRQPLFLPGKGPLADRSHHTHFEIFDIGNDGAPLPVEVNNEHVTNIPTALWQAIKSVNPESKRRKAVGRVTIVREPAPILFGALHYTMHKHFDMDELFKHLVEAQSTWCDFDRAFQKDPRRQSSFLFTFEYFTIIGDKCQPMSWQIADTQESRNPNHIAITRCSSVVALSLSGSHIKKIRNPDRRAGATQGFVYDPWSAYHILNIQCYPDLESSLDVHDSTQHYGMLFNGLVRTIR